MSPPIQWRIGFTIREARNLKTPGGAPIDPLVVVKCAGREFVTQIKRGKAGVVSWDESHLWTGVELKRRQLETTFLLFELQAANAFWRNDVVGSTSVQLSVVHNRKNHKLSRMLPLQLVNEPGVQGYLRVSVFVLGPNDAPPPEGDAEEDDVDGGDALTAAPDDIREAAIDDSGNAREQGKPYHVYISIHRVEDLHTTASKPERDPFFTVNFAGSKLKTTQARSTCSHTFNECFRLPAVTPLQEDTITLSLWDWRFMGRDELLAYGRLSFADLRSRPWFQRWYYFYGFDPAEVSSLQAFVADGDSPPPANVYLGRVLLSARTERVESFSKLLPAQIVAAKPLEDLATVPVSVVSDVYCVTGVSAAFSHVSLELSLGPISARTKWVPADPATSRDETDSSTCFSFDQDAGRLETLTQAMPLRETQRWDVILSVYGRRANGSKEAVRVGYNRFSLKSLPPYVQGSRRAPIWVPLYVMPASGLSALHSPAALVLLSKTDAEILVRDKRKYMSQADYELRCYCLAARNLPRIGIMPPSATVRVSVAGSSAVSSVCPRSAFPVWEDCVKIRCRLATDPSAGVSALAPVALTVMDRRKDLCFFLAKTSCTYDRVRGRAVPGETAPPLRPQWVKLRGRNAKDAAILVAIELTRANVKVPFSDPKALLRKCDLQLSLYGMRHLVLPAEEKGFLEWLLSPGAAGSKAANTVKSPVVVATMASYGAQGEKATEIVITAPKQRAEAGRSTKETLWRCGLLSSCDFFVTRAAPVYLPDSAIFDPHLTIAVYDRKIKSKNLVGDTAVRLLSVLPWVTDQKLAEAETEARLAYDERINLSQIAKVSESITTAVKLKQRGFVNLGITLLKEADDESIKEKFAQTPVARIKSKWITSAGEPEFLFQAYDEFESRGCHLYPLSSNLLYMNVFTPANVVLAAHGRLPVEDPRSHPPGKQPTAEPQDVLAGEYEQFYDDNDWPAVPLIRRIDGSNTAVTGGVKCATFVTYKGRSRGSVPGELLPLLADDAKFRRAYRDAAVVPAALRLRVYVMRGLGLALQGGRSTDDVQPYLSFSIGSRTETFRGNAKASKSNFDFCHLFESDLALPTQGRLEISVYSKSSGLIANDPLIGATVIDLEERWLSPTWQRLMEKAKIPVELRELRLRGIPHASFGTLQLWVEMLTPERALEVPRVVLRESPPVSLEVRVIVWGCRALKFKRVKKGYIDARVQVALDCPSYNGTQPLTQNTDVHYMSRNGNAIFNWRCVFSSIRLPVSTCVLQLAAFDYQVVGTALFVGEVNLELKSYLDKMAQDLSAREYDAEFRLTNRKSKNQEVPGFVQVTVQIMPQQDGSGKPAGLGRDPPNREPHLATPLDGRKWEDFVKSSGMRKDFSPFLQKLRVAGILLLFFILFIMAFVYPALFYQ